MTLVRFRLALPLAAGFGCALGILYAPLWWCTPLSLAAFFYAIWHSKNIREALTYGAGFGCITTGAGLLSLWEVVPPGASGVSLSTLFAAGFLWLVPTLALGAVTMLLALVLYTTRNTLLAPLCAVLAWVAHEELRMWAWMFLTYGPGAILEPHLSITALGYALADSAYFLQLAEGGGLLFLSLALAVFATSLALLPRIILPSLREKVQASTAVVIAAVVAVCPLLTTTQTARSEDTLTVAVFSSYLGDGVPPGISRLRERIAPTTTPDVLLLPEGKVLESVVADIETYEMLARYWLPPGKEALIIRSSERTDSEGARRNTIYADSVLEGTLLTQDKRFLMPEGEYLPYLSRLFLSAIPASDIETIREDASVVHGQTMSALPYNGITFGTLLCSEVFSPHLYKKLATEHGAQALVMLADPAWFQGSRLLYTKTVQIAKVHAVQNRAYFLAAQNSAPSFVINPTGELVSATLWGETDVLLVDIPKSD